MDLVDVAVDVSSLNRRVDDLEEMLGELAYVLGYQRNWARKTYERIKDAPIPKDKEE